MRELIYRKCKCGETAHRAYWDLSLKCIMYACRNCGAKRNPPKKRKQKDGHV